MRVDIDIITSIDVILIGPTVIMYVETFEIDVIVFIGNVIMCLTSHWPIISGIQSQFINYDNITPVKNLQITNNIIYQGYNHFSSYLVKLKLL
jgi:hypothetical protein